MLIRLFAFLCLAALPLPFSCSDTTTEDAASTTDEETTTTTEEDGSITTTTTASDGTTTATTTMPDGTKVTRRKKPDGTTTTTTVKTDGTTVTTEDDTTTTTNTDGSTSTSCALTANTTAASTANSYGCSVLTRDTSSCQASRTAQGLSGYWLKFSCRVTLTKSGANVQISTDSRPDTKSQYYATTDACYEAFSATGRKTNPSKISAQTLLVTVPMTGAKAASTTTVSGATIGVAVSGVSIFGNFAAPGDDIYDEAATFDKCEGHPQGTGNYHFHSEPTAITQADSAFVGVMRDGLPIYGRLDTDGTTPTLDAAGGHTGVTVDSPSTAVYHYHVNLQTNGTDSAYFISKGSYAGTVGTCTGCN
ncbi:MAG: YHYH protein [Pseudobdellovibrionaceae bacterium]|nr:YHYH protein [Pseudobdellovibrionaceae bacterium]